MTESVSDKPLRCNESFALIRLIAEHLNQDDFSHDRERRKDHKRGRAGKRAGRVASAEERLA
jgi:hypothetical protein